jgi:predicted hotdog family 3-hydroxylacyl-ACP dehydratase
MIVPKSDIASFLPHRAPFIMVDNLISATPNKIETDFLVVEGNIFLENGTLREFALIENIAQSSAVGLAVLEKLGQGKPVEGFLGGISKLKVWGLPKVNDTLYTIVSLVTQMGNMFLMKGENYVNGEKVLECEVKLIGV